MFSNAQTKLCQNGALITTGILSSSSLFRAIHSTNQLLNPREIALTRRNSNETGRED